MNLLEHYIKEIHSVEWVEIGDLILQEVDLTYDCYGVVTREIRRFFPDEWKEAKEQGYFMA